MRPKITTPIKGFRILLEYGSKLIETEGNYYASSVEEFAETFSRQIAKNSAKSYLGYTLHYSETQDYYQLFIHIDHKYARYSSPIITQWKFREFFQ